MDFTETQFSSLEILETVTGSIFNTIILGVYFF